MSDDFQLGRYELTGRTPPRREPRSQHSSVTPARQRTARVDLPDWMRAPAPPRLTLGDRVTRALARLPGGRATQRRWWAWQDRSRLYERYPMSFKIAAFFLSWTLATVLVLAAYGILLLA